MAPDGSKLLGEGKNRFFTNRRNIRRSKARNF